MMDLEPPHLAYGTNFAALSARLCHVDDKPKWKRILPIYEQPKGLYILVISCDVMAMDS